MIVYCCLGTAPLGKDRVAAVQAGVGEVLVAFPDVADRRLLSLDHQLRLLASSEEFDDRLPCPVSR